MNYNKRRNIILIAIILAIIAVLLVVILTVKKLTSKEYKLGKLGYTFDEINIILNNDKITLPLTGEHASGYNPTSIHYLVDQFLLNISLSFQNQRSYNLFKLV